MADSLLKNMIFYGEFENLKTKTSSHGWAAEKMKTSRNTTAKIFFNE